MSQLGFTEKEIVALLEKRRGRRRRMEQRNDLVVCEGLTKIYGSIRALDSLSLTLERGRFIIRWGRTDRANDSDQAA